jgi:hypothetical protein
MNRCCRFFVAYSALKEKDDKVPLRSIPPVHRGLANRGRSYRRAISVSPREATEFRVLPVTPVRQQSSTPKAVYTSIQDVKVIKTPHKASWEFPNGEFVVMVDREEVHVEVRLGRFIDALLVTTDKEQ